MDIDSLEQGLLALQQDERLWIEQNLGLHQTALEFIAVAEEFLQHQPATEADPLRQRLTQLKTQLLALNTALFNRWHATIRSNSYTAESLRAEFNLYTDYAPHLSGQPQNGRDDLDRLLDGIFEIDEPSPNRLSETEMVQYEPTPARLILELIDQARFNAHDVFYDLGSGLGRVVLLVNLLCKIRAKGIEVDPALHTQATATAQALGLQTAAFICADARTADFSDGTIFFLFTPFKGQLFRTVLLKLRQQAETKPIEIFSRGACSFWLAAQPWLKRIGSQPLSDFSLTYFETNL